MIFYAYGNAFFSSCVNGSYFFTLKSCLTNGRQIDRRESVTPFLFFMIRLEISSSCLIDVSSYQLSFYHGQTKLQDFQSSSLFSFSFFDHRVDRILGNTCLDGCFPKTLMLAIQRDDFGMFLFSDKR